VNIRHRLALLALSTLFAASTPLLAQQAAKYAAPRTESGQPDFQGVWVAAFVTTLERPAGVANLVVTPEQAKAMATAFHANAPKLTDPDVSIANLQQLARVKGEYRTSIIVEPQDGLMPFSKAGNELLGRVRARNTGAFDGPEDRPLSERCIESLGYAPMRTVPLVLPLQIVQTRDAFVIFSEGPVGLRVIHLGGQQPPDSLRTDEGYSTGRWEGDTLVVETTHLRAHDPARDTIGRPMLISARTKITERFTRASETELVYRYTVQDGELYTQPWSGEFSLTRHDGRMYEYACHEGNYSLKNGLSAARNMATGNVPRQ